MRIILIRHGDPNYEKDCLTELGHKQAALAAERLLSEDIEEIYSSPLGRARQTAGYFSEASGIKDIKILDFMQEIRYGCEGELYDDKWHPWKGADQLMLKGQNLQNDNWRDYPVYKENFATVDADKIGEETDKWLAGLGYVREGLYYRNKRPDDQQKTLAIFCHGGASSAFLARVFNQTFPYMCALCHFSHTGISVIRFNRKPDSLAMPVLELLNDDRHLQSLKS